MAQQEKNLFDLTPLRNVQWEEHGEDVVLIAPRFTSKFALRWLVPYLRNPGFRVTLDAYGSYFWRSCDGNATVGEIGRRMKEVFDPANDSMMERAVLFARRLAAEKFIVLSE